MHVGNAKYAEKVLTGMKANSYESRNRLVTEADALTQREANFGRFSL